MEYVEPIRKTKQIHAMKKILLAQSPRNYLLFTLGINSGLRISDILELKVKDLVNEHGKVRSFFEVREKKTGKYRKIAISKTVAKAVEAFLSDFSGQADQYVFASRKNPNRPISRVQAYRIIRDAARMVGIEDRIGTHTLRKTFGYHAYRSGVDLALLQAIFNHASQQETLRYIGITQDQMDEVTLELNL